MHVVPFTDHFRTFYIIVGNVHATRIGYLSIDDHDLAVVTVEDRIDPRELHRLVFVDFDASFPDVLDMLGVHVAALAVSAVIVRDAEEIADNRNIGKLNRIMFAALTGLLFTAVMFVCAAIREVFGNASFFGYKIDFLEPYKVSALNGAFGGYIVLAIVSAIIASVFNKRTKRRRAANYGGRV